MPDRRKTREREKQRADKERIGGRMRAGNRREEGNGETVDESKRKLGLTEGKKVSWAKDMISTES